MKRDFLFGEPPKTIDRIVRSIARQAEISPGDMFGQSRKRRFVRPRHAAMYLIRQHIGLSYLRIGQIFGDRDHTTVLHAVKAVESAPHLYPIGEGE